jgi:hypothetical protein
MSIKRTNPKVDRRTSGSGSAGTSATSKTRKKEITWQEAMADKAEAAFVNYTMREHFTLGTLLSHPRFGKGIVLNVEGQKMEVLFADSKKRLIMDTV